MDEIAPSSRTPVCVTQAWMPATRNKNKMGRVALLRIVTPGFGIVSWIVTGGRLPGGLSRLIAALQTRLPVAIVQVDTRIQARFPVAQQARPATRHAVASHLESR